MLLALSPAVPLPSGRLPDFSVRHRGGASAEQRAELEMLEERTQPQAKDRLKPPSFEERDFASRTGGTGAAMSGDLSAIFKDTALSTQRPDFQSFLKKGDERLKMLEQADRLPDLQSDFTTSQYKMVFRKSKELSGGLRPDQISPQKLRELLEEMERLGRKGGSNWSGDAAEGMEALEGGQTDRAMEAMQRALDKMRAQDEAAALGQGPQGRPRVGSRRQRPRSRAVARAAVRKTRTSARARGCCPARAGAALPRARRPSGCAATPYDVGVEGESRRGRKDGFDTNLTGRGGAMASRLQYLGVIGQYRKMMEDAITRESVPRDFHSQIKDYFQALDER